MTNPLLSIVIATKNRQKYAFSAVKSILSINDNRINVVVQDNSDNQTLKEKLNEFSTDERLMYRYTNDNLSFIDNFNYSLEISKGKYLCMIGDDDGINPEIIEATQWAYNNNVEVLVGNLSVNYRWDGIGTQDTFFTKMTGSTLTIETFSGRVFYPDIKKELIRFAQNGCTNYTDFKLPKLYHGIVRRDCLEKIKNLTGAYFKGLSPDIYSSIALATVIKSLIYIDYPLTIPGVCVQSGSVQEGQIKKHSKRMEDAPHLQHRGLYKWEKNVPPIYCVQTIWADSSFAALREMKQEVVINNFKEFSLYANIVAENRTLRNDVFLFMDERRNKSSFLTKLKDRLYFMYIYIKKPIFKFLSVRVLKRILFVLRIKRLESKTGLKDIMTAMNYLNKYLKENNFRIENHLK